MNCTDIPIEDTLDKLAALAVDITAPHHVHVDTNADNTVLWVNVNGVNVLRACRIGRLDFKVSNREKQGRRSLITAIALVALDGLRDCLIQKYRHLYEDGMWKDTPKMRGLLLVRRAILEGVSESYVDRDIHSALVNAFKTAGVETQEWTSIIKAEHNDKDCHG